MIFKNKTFCEIDAKIKKTKSAKYLRRVINLRSGKFKKTENLKNSIITHILFNCSSFTLYYIY